MLNHYEVKDFSAEIDKPIQYLGFIYEYFAVLGNRGKHGSLSFDENQADTFSWMLAEAGNTLHEMNEAFYGKEAKSALSVIPPDCSAVTHPENGSTLGEVIGRLQAIQRKHGNDLIVNVGGNELGTIRPGVLSTEEQAANGGELRNTVFMEGSQAGGICIKVLTEFIDQSLAAGQQQTPKGES